MAATRKRRATTKGHHGLPQALDMERSILGGILVDSSLFELANRTLLPTHFALDWHQCIYEAMRRLSIDNQPITTPALLAELNGKGLLDSAGGNDYVLKLEDGVVPDRASIATYVKVVIDRYVRRQSCHAAKSLYAQARDVAAPLLDVLATAGKQVTELRGIAEGSLRTTQQLRKLGGHDASLVADLERYFSDHAWLPNGGALTLALFALNTWVFDVFDTTPYLLLESAVPQCGKTTVLRLLEVVCRDPIGTSSASEAALFRVVEARHPTLLIDEAESLSGRSERAEALLSILNAGYKRGGNALRADGQSHEPKLFDTYSPKVLASIGGLRGALLDRCIVLTMHRRPPHVALKSSRARNINRVAAPLRDRLETYALNSQDELVTIYDEQSEQGYWPSLTDREGELWEPLMHHARLASKEVESRALDVALHLSGVKIDMQSGDKNFALARELWEALQSVSSEKFAPGDLLAFLAEAEAWGEVLGSKKDDKTRAADIGRFIRRYRLVSRERPHGRTTYLTAEAIEKIGAELPRIPDFSAANTASAAQTGNMRSTGTADIALARSDRSSLSAAPDVIKTAAVEPAIGGASAAVAAVAARESLSDSAATPPPVSARAASVGDDRVLGQETSITNAEPILKGEL